jgi:hypothetical protein
MAFRGAAVVGDGQIAQASSWVITIPAAAVAGDVAVMEVFISPVRDLTTPTGWTILHGPQAVSTHTRGWLLKRTLGAGEGGTGVTLGFSGNTRCIGGMVLSSGRTDTGLLSNFVEEGASNLVVAIPSITGVPAGADVIVFAGRRVGSSAAAQINPPAGYSQAAADFRTATNYGSATVNTSLEHMFKLDVAAGDYGGESGSTDVNAVGINYIVAVPAGTLTAPAALSGSGTLTASPGGLSATQGAALSGSGSLAAQPTPSVSRAAALSGSGALAGDPRPSWTIAAVLDGAGSLSGTAQPHVTRSADLSGSGTLAADVFGFVAPQLSGTGALTADVRPSATQPATLSGSGTLTATVRAALTQAVGLSGSGTLTAAASAPAVTLVAAFTGDGALSAIATPRYRFAWWTGTAYRRIDPKVWDGTAWRTDVEVTLEPAFG